MIFPLLHWLSSALCTIQSGSESNQPLPGTSQLTLEEDITSYLVLGVDRFLLSQLDQLVSKRVHTRNFMQHQPDTDTEISGD